MRELMKFTLLAEEQAKGEIPSKGIPPQVGRIPPKADQSASPGPKNLQLKSATSCIRRVKARRNASERELKVSTIMGHLAHYVERGDVDVMDLVPAKRLKMILPLAQQEGLSSKDIKDRLDPDFTYQEIKLARAYLRSIEDKED